jgi:hypothetical protein
MVNEVARTDPELEATARQYLDRLAAGDSNDLVSRIEIFLASARRRSGSRDSAGATGTATTTVPSQVFLDKFGAE